MQVLIISDMEGVSGIVKWEQVSGGESLYEEGRRLYTEEINAAVRGARAGGATEVVVLAMHAMAGADRGVLSHTVSGTDWHSLRFNGKPVGETGINFVDA